MFVHELIASRAQEIPHKIAIQDGQQQIAYRQLNDGADLLAGRLRAVGVEHGSTVGLCMQRSASLVIGALGILKAGAAYVPIDPTDPEIRVAVALEDAACKFIVTQKSMADELPAGSWQKIILGDESTLPPAGHEVAPAINPDDLAYVIFTSGSTGRPKGAQITHANLFNLISWHNRAFQVTTADQATMQASPGFDAAVWELWPYLVAGATVHIVEDSVRKNPEALRDWMVDRKITISFLPTALAEMVIALPWPAETSLRFLLTGADVLRRFPPPGLPFTLVNNYGPTECTVVATSGVVLPEQDSASLPTIGRPIDNVKVHVVDEQLNRVPEGMAGELLIGGAGVGRGYVGLPELTKQKFLVDCFSGVEGRLYRTGDLARVEPDGQIAFLGRIDHQVKIRGYRIELGEVEAMLERLPAIRSSVATSQSHDSGETHLVAYVVMRPDISTSAGELRAHLATQLPDYMIPATFVSMAELPFTSSGKVDRNALPAPSAENTLPDDAFEAPQSGIESWLANFLIKLLGVPQIGRNDNFFGLGGHSLLGAQLLARIQQTFDVELQLRSVFDHPTVSGIASQIANAIHSRLDAMSEDEARSMLESLSGEINV